MIADCRSLEKATLDFSEISWFLSSPEILGTGAGGLSHPFASQVVLAR